MSVRSGIITQVGPTSRDDRYRPRRVLMCPPTYFDVTYDINPWMSATLRSADHVDRALAERQWTSLAETYRSLGHTVEVIEPGPGLADMVFAANGATNIDGKVLTASFRHDERRGEEERFAEWFARGGQRDVRIAEAMNEGEGDFLPIGDVLLAGHGFRTTLAAHHEASRFFGRRTVSLGLVNPRYYHLDTALAILDDDQIAWYPPAFAPASRAVLHRMFPHAVVADTGDAGELGLNLFSDGLHVVMPRAADQLAERLQERGFETVDVDLSEMRKAGGSVKCCTLEIRDDRPSTSSRSEAPGVPPR